NFARKVRSLFLAYRNTRAKNPCPPACLQIGGGPAGRLATFDAPLNTLSREGQLTWPKNLPVGANRDRISL
ncbi:MAG: hypothetical protein KJ661_03550, partial [Candidatus Omnitrophica bacterium]|nr:hypothetical protein [Candidatus Omnitrophota bacterium]